MGSEYSVLEIGDKIVEEMNYIITHVDRSKEVEQKIRFERLIYEFKGVYKELLNTKCNDKDLESLLTRFAKAQKQWYWRLGMH